MSGSFRVLRRTEPSPPRFNQEDGMEFNNSLTIGEIWNFIERVEKKLEEDDPDQELFNFLKQSYYDLLNLIDFCSDQFMVDPPA